jgi:hypothetical protein
LSSNAGTLTLQGDTGEGAGGATLTTTVAFDNTGTLLVDNSGNDGASTAKFGGALTNYGAIDIGNGSLSASTTVTANGLNNSGALSLTGDASHLDKLVVNGVATNTGDTTIGADTELDVTGANSFVQSAGVTTVSGLLVASTIDANGGLLDFTSALSSGDGTQGLTIGAGGALEFGAGVDSSHDVTFGAATGALDLAAAGTFDGTIVGFLSNDVIDLTNTAVTGLAYSGNTTSGVLTVSGSSGTIATLAFHGDYSTSSFMTASDGHGGTDILDPRLGA